MSMYSVNSSIESMISASSVSLADKQKLRAMKARLASSHPPTPNDLATMTGDEPDPTGRGRANGLGARLMLGTNWHRILLLRSP